MIKITTAATALAVAFGAPAVAGSADPAPMDPVVPAPAPAPQWQGGYAGVELGFGHVDASPGGSDSGVVGGLIAGYDWQSGNTVYGVGFDIDATGMTLPGGILGAADVDYVARLKGRVGTVMGSSLVYGTAGATRIGLSQAGASLTDNGWFAGIGYETFVAENTTVGGELLYHGIDTFNGGSDLDATTLQLRVAYRF